MFESEILYQGIQQLANNIDRAFTFFLLVVRFSGVILLIPGIGAGARGLAVKYPFILMLAFTSMFSTKIVPVPSNLIMMCGMFVSELFLGACLASIPLLMIAIVQNAGQLSSTSMGLQAAAVMDPSTGTSISEVSRIMGNLCVIAFILVGGPNVVLYTASSLGGKIIPGSFVIGEPTLNLLIQSSSEVFGHGMVLAAPIIVALLLTNFVMGLISKAVPTVNIFIVSYPLTIGIGLIILMLMLPELLRAFEPMLLKLDESMLIILQDAQMS
jgi:flagellar biosynthetic protein FliR